jgi:hypothetical protein
VRAPGLENAPRAIEVSAQAGQEVLQAGEPIPRSPRRVAFMVQMNQPPRDDGVKADLICGVGNVKDSQELKEEAYRGSISGCGGWLNNLQRGILTFALSLEFRAPLDGKLHEGGRPLLGASLGFSSERVQA